MQCGRDYYTTTEILERLKRANPLLENSVCPPPSPFDFSSYPCMFPKTPTRQTCKKELYLKCRTFPKKIYMLSDS